MQVLNQTTSSETLLNRFLKIRQDTVDLCRPLEIEDYVPQPASFVSPPKWHLAHTSWFFEELILKANSPDYKVFDPVFGFLFNSYYQSLGERAIRDQRGIITRPTVARVYEYRRHVDNAFELLCSQILSQETQDLIELGINHEQQHQELLITDLKYTFSLNPIFPVYKTGLGWERPLDAPDPRWVRIKAGTHKIGALANSFSFDNEQPQHEVLINSCEIRTSLVSNSEYLEFVLAGGYENFQYWLDDGWAWLQDNAVRCPAYWLKQRDTSWWVYTLEGLQELSLDGPVSHVSYYEAAAFAQWKGCRLPSEFEWELACGDLSWGRRWEWTSSSYQVYPNYQVSEGAVGEYNGKFMVNQMVLKGASDATALGHSRPTYRNFFHPHLRWQLTSIRLANDIS
jgi:ergothioneine biosynthesis protein EgtB